MLTTYLSINLLEETKEMRVKDIRKEISSFIVLHLHPSAAVANKVRVKACVLTHLSHILCSLHSGYLTLKYKSRHKSE